MRYAFAFLQCLLSGSMLQAQLPFSYEITLPGTALAFDPERMEHLPNGNYALSGALEGADGFWLFGIEMDEEGTILDHYLHGIDPANEPLYAAPPLRSSDGGMLHMYKATPGNGNHVCFTKIDAQGDLVWNKCLDDTLYAQFPQARSCLMEKDGNYLAYARYQNVPVNVGWENALFQLSTFGDLQQILLFGEGETASDLAYAIVPTSDNGFLTTQLLHPAGSLSIYHGISIQRWTPDLSIAWSRQYDLGYSHYLEDLVPLSNGDLLLIAGKTEVTLGSRRSSLCRLDSAGNILWTRIIQHDEIVLNGAKELSNGTLICFGWTVMDQIQKVMVAHLAADGSLLSGCILDGSTAQFPFDADLTIDGSALVLSANTAGSGTVILAIDTSLSDACGVTPFTWSDTLITSTSFDRPLLVTSTQFNTFDVPALDQNWSFQSLDQCLPTSIQNTDHNDAVIASPNPCSDRLKITLPPNWLGSSSTSIRIANTQGALVISQNIMDRTMDLDVSQLESGPYVLVIDNEMRKWSTLLIVE